MKALALLLALSVPLLVLGGTPLPSIDFVGAGLDVTKVAFGGNYIRGALKSPLIQHRSDNYEAPTRPADSDWVIPKNLESKFFAQCEYDSKTREVHAASDYQHELSNVFSISVGYADMFSSTLSTTYTETTEITKQLDTVMVDTNAVCQYYELSLKPKSQELRGMFKNYVKGMTKEFDSLNPSVLKEYMDFIEEFGTHYLKGIVAGGMLQQRYQMTSFDYYKMTSSGIDVAFEASVSFGVQVSTSDTHSETTTKQKNFTASSTHSSVTVTGGDTKYLNDFYAWAPTIENNPIPVYIEAAPIFELLTTDNFGTSVYINQRRESVQEALQFYFQRYAGIPDLLPTFGVCERNSDQFANECEALCPSTHTVVAGACTGTDDSDEVDATRDWRVNRAVPTTNGFRCQMGEDHSTQVYHQGARAMALCARRSSMSDLPDNQGILAKTIVKQCTGSTGLTSTCLATCPADYVLTGGGCEPYADSSLTHPPMVSASGPSGDDDRSWHCATRYDAGAPAVNHEAIGYAICTNYTSSFRYRPSHYSYQLVRRDSGTTGDVSNHVSAECPVNAVLVGGGCHAYNAGDPNNSWRLNESWAQGSKWYCAGAQDLASGTRRQNVRATAICMVFDDPQYHR